MPGIYYTEILTTAIALAVFGTLIHKLRIPANERLLWLAAALVLPLQPLAFYLVRIPFDHWLVAQLGAASPAYRWLTSLYAPFTEEPAKLIPLLIPAIRRDITARNFVRYALAIGLGFAIGEMWFVAERVAQGPKFAGLPFYQFGGYVSERLMTCVFHSAFLSAALWGWERRNPWGFAGAMALHWLGNLPLLLVPLYGGGLSPGLRMVIIQYWLILYFFAAAGLLAYFATGRIAPTRMLFGQRHCPECDRDYDPPIFAVNFGLTRYERCPHCRKWHWTRAVASSK